MNQHYQIILKGNFQQSGFRFHAFQAAHDCSISGQVTERNGNIIIEAEGDEKDLEKFLRWCYASKKGITAPESIIVVKKPLAYYDEFMIL